MKEIKWYHPLILSIPITLIEYSTEIAQNISNLIVNYIVAYSVMWLLFKVTSKKEVESNGKM